MKNSKLFDYYEGYRTYTGHILTKKEAEILNDPLKRTKGNLRKQFLRLIAEEILPIE